jgi:plastocyanin
MKKLPVAILLVLAALGLAACGGGSSSSSESTAAETTQEEAPAGGGEKEASGGSEALKIEAAPSGLAFASDTAKATAGNVTVDFKNPQSVPHDVAIEDAGGEVIAETEVTSEGEASTTAELEPGTYTFFCTIPGHREAGMEGTLTVK